MHHAIWMTFVCLLAVQLGSAEENLLTSYTIMHGYVFPASVTAAVGESVHLKVLLSMNEEDRCLYREPGSTEDIDVHGSTRRRRTTVVPTTNSSSTKQRFSSDSRSVDPNECGIKVLNINHEDAGFWRLTLARGTTLIRGVTLVNVIDVPTVPNPSDRDSITGLEEVTPTGTDYCYVLRDTETQGRDVPMYEQCSLKVTSMDPTGNGQWNVIAGVRGYMREMQFAINIEHREEQIVTSIHRGAEFQVLVCQLRYSRQTIRFCRFLRLSDQLGLNMLEGVGWGRYRYYGNGFETGDCGLEIDDPDGVDRGLWKCVVGYGDEQIMKVSGAILDGGEEEAPLAILRVEDVNGLNGTEVKLQCNANKPLDYCWFKDPLGVIYSVSEVLMEDEEGSYWYEGISLAMGDCGIRLKPVTEEMTGRWSCHVGSSRVSALEVSSYVNVRYCRFITPSGQAFSLDESVTSENAILGNYYSNPNHNPKKGFCSLVVMSVSSADIGQWICAGKIAGHTMEQYAAIEVSTESAGNPADLSTASIVGMALGGAVILVGVVGLGYYNYWRRVRKQVVAVNHEIELQERAQRRFSIASGTNSSSKGSDNQLRTT
ncbi:hypothetical protein pipiens_014919 [Culex pipiens pipiens]|uniref:Immunoglobulin domain-containing protein n=1 Tax=Culex pipiens pipiens TaxID=38569 RepID=A0ABD1CSL2_CULPP